MTSSKILFYFCLFFIFGIFSNSILKIPQLLALGFLISGILLIFVPLFLKKEKISLIGFFVLLFVLGALRQQVAEDRILNSQLKIYNDKKENVALIGVIAEEPDIREKSQKLTITVEEFNSVKTKTREKILITANRYPEYQYGDKLKIIGKPESPPTFQGFNYQNYLKKDEIYSVMSWPKIELAGQGFGNPIKKALFSFKNKFKMTSQNFISPPQVGILEALVFGDEQNISQFWKDKLNSTGLRHITAVSGMNITIIGFLIISFALALGFWRQQALFLSLFLLVFYILMIGAPASAIRAGIMAGLLMLAEYFGRLSAAVRAIVSAAALMLIINPLLLVLDIGFQLSFLAILGIVCLQPVFSHRLKKIPNPKFFPIKTTLAATLAAQVFVLPVLVYNFGYFSLISPLANILIVPILAPLTILIFVFGLSAMIFKFLGLILLWPVWLCLTYIIKIIDFSSQIPFSIITLKISLAWLAVLYLLLIIFVWQIRRAEKYV